MATYTLQKRQANLGNGSINLYNNNIADIKTRVYDNNSLLLSMDKTIVKDSDMFTGTNNYYYHNKKIYQILNEIPNIDGINTNATWYCRDTWNEVTYGFRSNDTDTYDYNGALTQWPSTQDYYAVKMADFNPDIDMALINDKGLINSP